MDEECVNPQRGTGIKYHTPSEECHIKNGVTGLWVAPCINNKRCGTHHITYARVFSSTEAYAIKDQYENETGQFHDVWNESMRDGLIPQEGGEIET